MAYDEGLAQRIREILRDGRDGASAVVERKMFGGTAFLVGGNMAVGVSGDRLMVRVGPEAYEEALALPHTAPMDFTGKPLRGFVYVDADGIAEDEDLAAWIGRGAAFAGSLPDK
jgi:TfoX/Sxy family transcriptional regulator of competence genes